MRYKIIGRAYEWTLAHGQSEEEEGINIWCIWNYGSISVKDLETGPFEPIAEFYSQDLAHRTFAALVAAR